MNDSILTSTKKVLGITEEYTEFDADITMHINSVFDTLTQLGLGPVEGFTIEDKSTPWIEFLAMDKNLSSVKTYMFLRVKLLFDPPETSFARESMSKQIQELEWRLNVYREGRDYPHVLLDTGGYPTV